MTLSRLTAAYAGVEALPRLLSRDEAYSVAYYVSGYAPEAFLRAVASSASSADDVRVAAQAALAALPEDDE